MVCLYSDFTSIQSVRLALTVVDEENGVCMCGKIWQRYGNLGGPVGLSSEAIGDWVNARRYSDSTVV